MSAILYLGGTLVGSLSLGLRLALTGFSREAASLLSYL